jgi:hypothetical protein
LGARGRGRLAPQRRGYRVGVPAAYLPARSTSSMRLMKAQSARQRMTTTSPVRTTACAIVREPPYAYPPHACAQPSCRPLRACATSRVLATLPSLSETAVRRNRRNLVERIAYESRSGSVCRCVSESLSCHEKHLTPMADRPSELIQPRRVLNEHLCPTKLTQRIAGQSGTADNVSMVLLESYHFQFRPVCATTTAIPLAGPKNWSILFEHFQQPPQSLNPIR